jgi:hypothetical protein
MEDFWVHKRGSNADGDRIAFGPKPRDGEPTLTIPKELTRRVTYRSNPLTLNLTCSYAEDKLQLVKVEIANFEGFISTRELLQLKLPAVMRHIALEAVGNAPEFIEYARNHLRTPSSLRSNLKVLAQLYWLETVTWGTPRKTIMEMSGCSRSTANETISLAEKEFELPKERTETFDPNKTRKIAEDAWLIPDPDAQD